MGCTYGDECWKCHDPSELRGNAAQGKGGFKGDKKGDKGFKGDKGKGYKDKGFDKGGKGFDKGGKGFDKGFGKGFDKGGFNPGPPPPQQFGQPFAPGQDPDEAVLLQMAAQDEAQAAAQ